MFKSKNKNNNVCLSILIPVLLYKIKVGDLKYIVMLTLRLVNINEGCLPSQVHAVSGFKFYDPST